MRSRLFVGLAVVVLSSVAVGALAADAVGAAKKPKSCRLLKASQISKVLEQEVSGPGDAGTLDIACDFDIGAGLGEPGGGTVIVQYYKKGPVASTVFAQMQKGTEGYKDPGQRVRATKVWWDGADAWVRKKGAVVVVGASYTNDDPPPETLQDQMVELAQVASKKL